MRDPASLMRPVAFISALLVSLLIVAQHDTITVPHSEFGWHLTPHGTIRVLVLYAEIDYDVNPAKDPQPNAAPHWPKGQLPAWKDEVFDAFPSDAPKGVVTRYFGDMSLGDFTVLGDYVDHLFTIKESEAKNLGDLSSCTWNEANKLGQLHTAHNLTISDFDLWQDKTKLGYPNANVPDDPHSYDHVMVILRNSWLTHGQGSTDGGSAGKLYGYASDTQSRFGGMNALPFDILRHEFHHLLLGGNNFHSGGGNAPIFSSYFICQQGGWSMMGAANSSLMTGCGWDRDRLGWKPAGSPYRLCAHTSEGAFVNSDLDPVAGDTGLFILKDFVTSGDVMRIRMPFLPGDEFPQWIWLENHQTRDHNGCPTDLFHYQDVMPCVKGAVPGIYSLMQVDREDRVGRNIFSGEADYLRAIPASGNYDFELRGDTVTYQCLWPGPARPYFVRDRMKNPLTGSMELEIPVFDANADGLIDRSKDGVVPRVEIRDGKYLDEGAFLGNPRQAFTRNGNHRMGMGTNPSTANMLTLVSSPKKDKYKGAAPNNRVVYLNGISVELLEQRSNGDIVVRVRANDTYINNDVRWCADSIVLPALKGYADCALFLAGGKTLLLERSHTPTRIDAPEKVGRTNYFSDVTHFTISPGARMRLASKARLDMRDGSVLHVMPGAELVLDAGSKLVVDSASLIVLHGDARITGGTKAVRKLKKKKRLVELP